MDRHRLVVIALASATLLALELAWTRIFSAEFFYTFAFLTLSLAVMGLGLGALALRLCPVLGRESALGVSLSLAGLAALAGPALVFRLGLDFQVLFASWAMAGRFLATILLLGAAFFFVGVALAWIFRRHSAEMPRLYAADLLGAGAGVLLSVWAMNAIGTQVVVFLSALPVLVAALLVSRRWWKTLPFALVVALAVLIPRADALLEAPREERAPVIYKHWDAMAKVKVYDFGGNYRGINVDNVANTPVVPFDGDWDQWYADPENSRWDIDAGYLVAQFDSCVFLSLGSGGGMDVLQALDKGATEIHAVEVNGHINRMMTEGDPSGYVTRDSAVVDSTGRVITMAEYSGHIYRDPRVRVVTEDARTYVRRHRNTFDVIYSLSSNTWAALGSGAFALTENYLFTREAFADYWNALSDGGFLSMEHQVYMPRLVSALVDALADVGVERPGEHFAVYNLPRLRRNLLLVSKRPLTEDFRYRAYGELTPEYQQHIHPLYPAPDSLRDNLVARIVGEGWRAMADSAGVNISPCTDDRPFIAQMGLWRNLDRDKLERVGTYAEFSGFPLSKLTILVILAAVLVLVVPLNLLPYLQRGEKLRPVPWLYFFAIGVAFMAVEVVLIQKYTLFIGASVYSIATVLLVLLVASGVGSRVSERVSTRAAFLGIVLWLVLDVFVLPRLTTALVFLPLPMRAVVTALFVAPLGFFMGMPFPKGALRVGERVDWAFAVNGAASVLGATAVLLVAITYGFSAALLIAAGVYLAAFALVSLRGRW
ncbi:MAG: hypothetical protein OEO21_04685 [Candidatus Krumholzibacteria bacterium]|nr:hypothetical protein [Candidatus Krumholzibacteria bacterium]